MFKKISNKIEKSNKNNIEDINDNVISRRWKKRFSELPKDIQNKILELNEKDIKEYQLKVIKRKRKDPKTGDIFVVSPREGIYFYGRVLNANINHIEKNSFLHGNHVIVIFKSKSKTIDMFNYMANYDDLLIVPRIVHKKYWTSGYFYTIDNIPNTDYEDNLDYGFYDIHNKRYLKEDGTKIFHKPKLFNTYGISTMSVIANEIETEIIINPKLLEF